MFNSQGVPKYDVEHYRHVSNLNCMLNLLPLPFTLIIFDLTYFVHLDYCSSGDMFRLRLLHMGHYSEGFPCPQSNDDEHG
jgi:hypothetical protein